MDKINSDLLVNISKVIILIISIGLILDGPSKTESAKIKTKTKTKNIILIKFFVLLI